MPLIYVAGNANLSPYTEMSLAKIALSYLVLARRQLFGSATSASASTARKSSFIVSEKYSFPSENAIICAFPSVSVTSPVSRSRTRMRLSRGPSETSRKYT